VAGGCSAEHDKVKAPYYRHDLARAHHLGFGFHADACAPGIIELLRPIRERDGLVLEVGCGSGLLTKHLVAAGHRVIATDASPAMLEIARDYAAGAHDVRPLALPHDPVPEADAIVSTGHAISYLDDEPSIESALISLARALRPGGIIAIDVCDLEWGDARANDKAMSWVEDDWVLTTRFSLPSPNKFVREMTVFVRNDDGSWSRDDERHDNCLVDTARIPDLLSEHGIDASIEDSFGAEELPPGLKVVVGRKVAP
jgi:SAM-dependent methyltransferase